MLNSNKSGKLSKLVNEGRNTEGFIFLKYKVEIFGFEDRLRGIFNGHENKYNLDNWEYPLVFTEVIPVFSSLNSIRELLVPGKSKFVNLLQFLIEIKFGLGTTTFKLFN